MEEVPWVKKCKDVEKVSLQEVPPWESAVQLSLQLPPLFYNMIDHDSWL